MAFSRLIRFKGEDGGVYLGEPDADTGDAVLSKLNGNNLHAAVFKGSSPFKLGASTAARKKVAELLPILSPTDVPIIRCIGLNYVKHIQEGGRSPPPYPSMFTKSSHAIASYKEDIPIHAIAQDNQLDYEGELSIVIGKTGKDISTDQALDHVAGYVVSNDISARTWQRNPKFAGPVPQWDFSKGFDKFAPMGPVLVSPQVVGDASNLRIQTWVDGELRQDSNTSDLLFGVKEIVAFISQGSTLEQGTVIMTGTPAGVAMGMKPEPKYLVNGNVVKVSIEGLGSVENKMSFQ